MLNTDGVNEELVQAAKAAAELEPAIEAFAEATGALGPVRESTGWLGDVIRARREAHLAKVLMKAAEKIKASGLPAHAVRDKLLRAVVEDGSMEDDEGIQERWATLLANAATDSEDDKIKLVYLKILAELEPKEALLLDRLWEKTPNPAEEPFETVGHETTNDLVDIPELYNLSRLGVLRLIRSMNSTIGGQVSESALAGVQLTELGWEFVKACNPPS
jgi:Abortive infection alpha